MGITFALATVIIVLYYILLRIPAGEELVRQNRILSINQKELTEKQAIADDLKNWQDQVQELETKLAEALKKLPEKVGYENLIVTIPNIAKKNNLEVLEFELLSEDIGDGYMIVPIELKLTGPYIGLLRFVQEVGEHPRIMKIKNIEVKPGKEVKDAIVGTARPVLARAELITYRFEVGE